MLHSPPPIPRLRSLSLALIAAILAWISTPVRAATTNVVYQDFSFTPQTVTINVGDTVVWTNGGGTHTVTGDGADAFCGPNAIPVSCSTTFTNAGVFPYHCNFHQSLGMVGTVNVVQPSNGPPSVTIISPTNNTVLSAPGGISITATNETGASLAQVEFFDNGQSIGKVTASPFTLSLGLSAGTHFFTAVGTDSSGATSTSAGVTVVVNFPIPDPIPQKIPESGTTIELSTVVEGWVSPIGLAAPDDGSGRLFVYDQIGLIYIVRSGTNLNDPLLDVQSRLVPLNPGYDERGLLGVAPHPQFSAHPFVYTYTSEPNGPAADFPIVLPAGETNNCQSVIAEWKIDPANPNRLDPASRREILRLDKPEFNHNGGTLRFGPDGFLYFSVGDGGAGDDQGPGHSDGGNGQDKSKILGKMLRIDVDARTSANGQYGIPLDNPFVGQAGVVQEIYAYGLRNPYSYSFDSQTGDLYLGDVGQNQIEEVDIITKGGNFGWSVKEGSFFFDANGTNDGFVTLTPVRQVPPGLIDPIAEYDHDEGKAVIGGGVYRGSAIAELMGTYVFGDLEGPEGDGGRLFLLNGSQPATLRIGLEDRALGLFLKGFGRGADGELYALGSTQLGPSGNGGKLLKIVPAPTGLQNSFVQHNLVADLAGQADLVDTNLVNPWGIATSPTSPFWVSDNHSGVSTLYNTTNAILPLVVTIPPPSGGNGPAAPTGVIFNGGTNFMLPAGAPAKFIFATEDGTISGWSAGTNAILTVDHSASGAVYKGLALASAGGSNYLYAANFNSGAMEVFDAGFHQVNWPGAFVDTNLPPGYAPFNVTLFGDALYVTYAKQDDAKHDDDHGLSRGFVDIYNTSGSLVTRLISGGALDSPWGLAVAPAGFGPLGGALLVGNFGNGAINAFNATNGAFLAALNDPQGKPIRIEGLWGLRFGNGANGGDANVLYFTAGPSGEEHGLFGSLSVSAASGLRFASISAGLTNVMLSWTGGLPPYFLQMKMNLLDTNWTDVLTTSNQTATLDIAGNTGFFRVSFQPPAGGAVVRPPPEGRK